MRRKCGVALARTHATRLAYALPRRFIDAAVFGLVEFDGRHGIGAVAHPLHVAVASMTHLTVRAPYFETRRILIQWFEMHAEKTRMIERRGAAETEHRENVGIDGNAVGIRDAKGWQCRDVASTSGISAEGWLIRSA